MVRHHQEMVHYVAERTVPLCPALIAAGVLRVERLGHVETIQPHLVRVYGLMPETSFAGARVPGKLLAKGVHRHAVLLLPGPVQELEQRLSRAYVVGGIIAQLVGSDLPVLRDDVIIPLLDIIEYVIPSVALSNVQESLQLQAGSVVPLQFALQAVQVARLGAAGHFAPDHLL